MTFRMGILIKDWRTWHRGGGTAAWLSVILILNLMDLMK
jgi:hypothetical protein